MVGPESQEETVVKVETTKGLILPWTGTVFCLAPEFKEAQWVTKANSSQVLTAWLYRTLPSHIRNKFNQLRIADSSAHTLKNVKYFASTESQEYYCTSLVTKV